MQYSDDDDDGGGGDDDGDDGRPFYLVKCRFCYQQRCVPWMKTRIIIIIPTDSMQSCSGEKGSQVPRPTLGSRHSWQSGNLTRRKGLCGMSLNRNMKALQKKYEIYP